MVYPCKLSRKLGPRNGAHKLFPLWWMGAVIVQVTSLQEKPEKDGSKDPECCSTRRSRGSRGRRIGRARDRQSRSSLKAPPTTPQSQPPARERRSYKERARAKCVSYVDRVLRVLVNLHRKGKTIDIKVDGVGYDAVETWPLWIHRSMKFILSLQSKRPPLDVMLRVNDVLVPLVYEVQARDAGSQLYAVSEAARLAKKRRNETRLLPGRGVQRPLPKSSKTGRCVCLQPSAGQICRFCGMASPRYNPRRR